MKKFPKGWHIRGQDIYDADGMYVATWSGTIKNAQRIVDCVNGCVNLKNPLAVGELLEACKRLMQHKDTGDLHSIDFQRVRQTINNVEGE